MYIPEELFFQRFFFDSPIWALSWLAWNVGEFGHDMTIANRSSFGRVKGVAPLLCAVVEEGSV